MITIRLLDARRGLNLKCRELFKDEKIAEEIYRFLCDGIEECEDAEPERKGRWIDCIGSDHWKCSECGDRAPMYWDANRQEYDEWPSPYCPNCGAHMKGAEDELV